MIEPLLKSIDSPGFLKAIESIQAQQKDGDLRAAAVTRTLSRFPTFTAVPYGAFLKKDPWKMRPLIVQARFIKCDFSIN